MITKAILIEHFGSLEKAANAVPGPNPNHQPLTRYAPIRWKDEPPIGLQCMFEIVTGGRLKANRGVLGPFIEKHNNK